MKIIVSSISVLFNIFVIAEPLKHFHIFHGTPINKKLKKHELHVKKANILLLETSTNKQSLQKLKSKKFNDSVVLEFLLQSLQSIILETSFTIYFTIFVNRSCSLLSAFFIYISILFKQHLFLFLIVVKTENAVLHK